MIRLTVLLAGVLLSLLAPRVALAQTCNRSCSVELRDARGCCPPPAATTAPIRPAPPPVPPKPAECTEGTAIGPDTAGHCCWPSQVWASNRCVGVPASCPANRRVDAKTQECALISCDPGMVRMEDGVHCCFPKQGWSGSRNICVGVPGSCPKGLEAEGETCVSVDKDGDGILNATDACPTEAEDKDGFKDEDGCPDPDNDGDKILDATDKCPNEAEDINQYKDDDGCPDETELKGVHAAEATRKQQEAAAAAALEAQEAARRAEAEEAKRRAAQQAAREQSARNEQEAREGRASRRTLGAIFTIGGGVAGVTSTIFMALGSGQNSTIKEGGLATSKDISDAASTGRTYNAVAITTGLLGVVSLGIGVPLWLLNGEPESPRVSLTVGPTRIGVAGRF